MAVSREFRGLVERHRIDSYGFVGSDPRRGDIVIIIIVILIVVIIPFASDPSKDRFTDGPKPYARYAKKVRAVEQTHAARRNR
jgi:hypothetical protein